MHHPIALRGLALSGPRSTTPLVVCPPVDPMQRLFSDLRGAARTSSCSSPSTTS